MAKRVKPRKVSDKKKFRQTAVRTAKINTASTTIPRGGIRL